MSASDYSKPVALADIDVDDDFWEPHVEMVRGTTVEFVYGRVAAGRTEGESGGGSTTTQTSTSGSKGRITLS